MRKCLRSENSESEVAGSFSGQGCQLRGACRLLSGSDSAPRSAGNAPKSESTQTQLCVSRAPCPVFFSSSSWPSRGTFGRGVIKTTFFFSLDSAFALVLAGMPTTRDALLCCRLCALRFCGERNPQAYRRTDTEPPAAGAAACSLCLGALDSATLDSACASAAGAAATYDASQFALNVHLPSSHLVRERAAWLHATGGAEPSSAAAGADSGAGTAVGVSRLFEEVPL